MGGINDCIYEIIEAGIDDAYIGWCKIRLKRTNGKLPRWFCKEYEVRDDE